MWYLYHGRRYLETKGMVVNTFQELEPYAIHSLRVTEMPQVYSIGPVLDLLGPAQWHPDRTSQEKIMRWLDDQPPSSVVFLCFGSIGSLSEVQLRERLRSDWRGPDFDSCGQSVSRPKAQFISRGSTQTLRKYCPNDFSIERLRLD